jgi:hypothetical protein
MFSGRWVLVIMEAIALHFTPRTPQGDRLVVSVTEKGAIAQQLMRKSIKIAISPLLL